MLLAAAGAFSVVYGLQGQPQGVWEERSNARRNWRHSFFGLCVCSQQMARICEWSDDLAVRGHAGAAGDADRGVTMQAHAGQPVEGQRKRTQTSISVAKRRLEHR